MLRQILIVHGQPEVTKELDRIITTNLYDASVVTAANIAQAMEVMGLFNIHLILLDPEVVEDALVETYHEFQAAGSGKLIPMLLLTENKELVNQVELPEGGVLGCLPWPCEEKVLCWKVRWLNNLDRLRGSRRYNIPQTGIVINQGDNKFTGRIVDVSEGGFFCQLGDAIGLDWSKPIGAGFSFALGNSPVQVEGFKAILVRLNVLRIHEDHTPAQIQAAFRFTEVPPASRQELRDVFASCELENLNEAERTA